MLVVNIPDQEDVADIYVNMLAEVATKEIVEHASLF